MPDALVLITTSFPIRGDGSEAAGGFVVDLAEALAHRRPVRVVAPGHTLSLETWSQSIEIFRYASPKKPLSTLKLWNPWDLLAIRSVLVSGETATRQAVRVGPTAHILALWALPSGHWARRIGQAANLPYSVWTLGSDIWTLGRIPGLRAHLRRVLRGAQNCFSDGYRLAKDTQRIAGRAVEFLPSTRHIERNRTMPLKKAPPYRLIFLGRWHPNKGVDLLIEALKLLGKEDWQKIEAVEICGGGPLELLVRVGVEALRAAGHPVVLRGYLDKPAAEAAILNADYLLIPSRIESIPVVFSDAVKLKCVPITTPVGDLPSLIDTSPACGLLARNVSAEGIAVAIQRAIRGCAADFTVGLERVAARFDLESIAEAIHDVAGNEMHD